MTKLEMLQAELTLARLEVYNIEREIRNVDDGFLYFTCLRSYGSVTWDTHVNEVSVQNLCYDYSDGHDGIVDVYTNNPNNTIQTSGLVEVLSLDELQNLSKDNVNMTTAITNWIAKCYVK